MEEPDMINLLAWAQAVYAVRLGKGSPWLVRAAWMGAVVLFAAA
jgi:hypothetical protein